MPQSIMGRLVSGTLTCSPTKGAGYNFYFSFVNAKGRSVPCAFSPVIGQSAFSEHSQTRVFNYIFWF